jgi:type I restriction enzyme, S subunit
MSALPPGWTDTPTETLLEASIGGVWGGEPGVYELETTVVRVADFRDNGSINLDSAPIRSVTARQLASRELRPGDILLEKSGGGTTKPVGRVVRMRPANSPVVPTNFVQLLRPDARLIEPGFLFWWLWKSHVDGTAAQFQRATTNIRNLRTKDYLARAVPLPPLNEQRRIVAAVEEHLSRLDAADASLAAVKVRLKPLRDKLLTRMLDGQWPAAPVGEVAEVISGPAFKSGEFGGPDEGIPLLRGDNIEPGSLRWRDTRTWPETKLDGYEHLYIQSTDLILGMDRPVISTGLKLAPVRERDLPALLVQRVARIRPNGSVLTAYLHAALQLPRFIPHVIRDQTGTQLPHTTLAGVRSFEIPLPPLEEQRRIVAEVEERLSAIDALRARSSARSAARPRCAGPSSSVPSAASSSRRTRPTSQPRPSSPASAPGKGLIRLRSLRQSNSFTQQCAVHRRFFSLSSAPKARLVCLRVSICSTIDLRRFQSLLAS